MTQAALLSGVGSNANSGGTVNLTNGTAVASTSGTSIDFTGIPSWVKRITLMLYGVQKSTASQILLQLGTSGGIVSSGYAAGTSVYAGSSGGNVGSTAGIPIDLAGSGDIAYGKIEFTTLGSNIWVATGIFSPTGASSILWFCAGAVTLGGSLTTVRVTTISGSATFSAGSINILYE